MARLQNTVRWRDFSAGNMQKISPDIAPGSSVPFSLNLEFDNELGFAVSRKGTDIVNAQLSAGNPGLGLFQHLDTDPDDNKLLAAFGGSIFDVLTAVQEVSGLDSSAKKRFLTYLNTTLILDGVDDDKRAYSSGGGFVSGGSPFDLDNLPTGAQFPQEFKDRVYVAVDDELHFSTTPDDDGNISWVNPGSGSIPIEMEDGGGKIQGIDKVPGYLMIFKQRSLKRWDFVTTYPDDLVNIGTQSKESIVRARGFNFFFYGPKGFYQTNGGYPKRISRPVQRFIDGMDSAFYEHVNGWSDNEHIYWSIGDVTLDWGRGFTETYTNVVLRYTIDTEQWAPMQYYHKFRNLTQYIAGTDVLVIGADSDGQVLKLNTGNTDYASTPKAIRYILQSPELDFQRREHTKAISEKILVHSDGTRGAQLQCRIDYKDWKEIGSILDIVTEIELKKTLNGKVFEFRIVDSITGEQVKLRGLDFPNVDVNEDTKSP